MHETVESTSELITTGDSPSSNRATSRITSIGPPIRNIESGSWR